MVKKGKIKLNKKIIGEFWFNEEYKVYEAVHYNSDLSYFGIDSVKEAKDLIIDIHLEQKGE